MRLSTFIGLVVPGLLVFIAGAIAGGELFLFALGVRRLWPMLGGTAFCAAGLIAGVKVAQLMWISSFPRGAGPSMTDMPAGLVTVCSYCRKVRDHDETWLSFESFLERRTQMQFSHGICPQCEKKVRSALV